MHEIESNAGEGLTTIGKLQVDAKCESDPVRKNLFFFENQE